MGLIDQIEQRNMEYAFKFSDLYNKLSEKKGKELGESPGNPVFTDDINLHRMPTTLDNMYGFLKVETSAHYKTMDSKFSVTNQLIGELIDITYKMWGESQKFNPKDLISESNSDLSDAIKELNTKFYNESERYHKNSLSALQELLDETENPEPVEIDPKQHKEFKDKFDKMSNKLSNIIEAGFKTATGVFTDTLLTYGTNYYDNEFTNKIADGVEKVESKLDSGVKKLGAMTSGLTSGLKNVANSLTGGMGNLMDLYTNPQIQQAFAKYGSEGIKRAAEIFDERLDIMKELIRDYGYSESEAKRIATQEMTRTGTRDYYRVDWDTQFGWKRSDIEYEREIRLRRRDEKRRWEREALLESSGIFKTTKQIAIAKDQIYEMDRIMPDLNFQSTELYQTMISVFDDTGKMSKEIFEEIRDLSKNLMVDPQTLASIGDTYTKYLKLMTKGGIGFQKQMTNVLKVTAKLEDQFLDSNNIMSEVQDIGFTMLGEMSDDLLTKTQLYARELGISAVELQRTARMDPSKMAEMLLSAKKGYAERMGIDASKDIGEREMAILRQIGVSGFESITDFLSQSQTDLSQSDKQLLDNEGIETGILKRQQELEDEVWDRQQEVIQREYDYRMNAWESEMKTLHEWNDSFYTDWEKRKLEMDKELLNNEALDTWNNRLKTASNGLRDIGDVASSAATKMQAAGVAMFDGVGSFISSLFSTIMGGKLISKGLGKTAPTTAGRTISGTLGNATFNGGMALSGGNGVAGSIGATQALGAGVTLAGAAATAYGIKEGVSAGKQLADKSQGANAGYNTAALGSAGLAAGGGVAATLAGIGVASGPVGWIGLAVASVGIAAVETAKELKSMHDPSVKLREALEQSKESFIKSKNELQPQYEYLATSLSNVNNILEPESTGTIAQLQSLTQELQNGRIDQFTYNEAVTKLAAEDGTSGALDILTEAVATNQITDGTFNEAVYKLANGEDGGALAMYYTSLSNLTQATDTQTQAIFDQITKIDDKIRRSEVDSYKKELISDLTTKYGNRTLSNSEMQELRQALTSAGVANKDIAYRLRDNKMTEKELGQLINGTFGIFGFGIDSLDENISKGKTTVEKLNTLGVNQRITTDSEFQSSQADKASVLNVLNNKTLMKMYKDQKGLLTSAEISQIQQAVKSGYNMKILQNHKTEAEKVFGKEGLASTFGIPKYAIGISSIPNDQFALVHKGERIIPAEDNKNLGKNIVTIIDLNSLQNELFKEFTKSLYKRIDNLTNITNSQLQTVNSNLTSLKSSNIQSDILKAINDIATGFKPFWDLVKDAKEGNKSDLFNGGFGEEGSGKDPYAKYGITSKFGPRKPVAGISGYHKGIDYALPKGTPISAFDNGIVVKNSYDSKSGNYVIIENPEGYKFSFCHLNSRSPLSIGDEIKPGSTIGYSGNTGASTGPHLHLGIRNPKGDFIDPQKYFESNPAKYSSLRILNDIFTKIGIIKMLTDFDEYNGDVFKGKLGPVDLSWMRLKEVGTSDISGYKKTTKLNNKEWAYGAYQFTAKGSMDNTKQFINWMTNNGYQDIATILGNGLVSGHGGKLFDRWKQAYNRDPQRFKNAQDAFEYYHFVAPLLNKYGNILNPLGSKVVAVAAGHSNWMGMGGINSIMKRMSGNTAQDYMNAARSYIRSLKNYPQWKTGWENRLNSEAKYLGVHETGLSKVPYDNYPALLHKDERVLNASEARLWNNVQESRMGNYEPSVQDVTVYVDTDAVIDSISALTDVVKEIHEILKPKTHAPVQQTVRPKSNLITQYV